MDGLNAGLAYQQRGFRDLGTGTPQLVQIGTGVITAYVTAQRLSVSATGQPLSASVTGKRLSVTVTSRE